MSTLAYWNEIVSEYNDNLNCKEEIVKRIKHFASAILIISN